MADASDVVLAARNYVQQAGEVRVSELEAAHHYVTAYNSILGLAKGIFEGRQLREVLAETNASILITSLQVGNRLVNRPDDPRETYGRATRLLQALANAEIGRGEYELWAADREVFRVLNAAVTAAKLTVLLGTVHASGSALTPLLAAEISGALASGGLQVYEWFTEQPEDSDS